MIPIQNLYYLLCYAWDSLEEGEIVRVGLDACKTAPELFARVLEAGVVHLLKRGLDRGYITLEEDTGSLRGKIDLSETVKRNLLPRAQVLCHVDSFSHDVLHNRILKSTLTRIIRCEDLDRDLRDRLVRLHRRLHDIRDIPLSTGVFGRVALHRNNAFFGFLLHICRLVFDLMLVDGRTGKTSFRDFIRDERQMAGVFEQFVRNFYHREQDTFRVRRERIYWRDVRGSPGDLVFLPTMRTDVSLHSPTRKIILETKYYASTLQSHYASETVHSGHLYQLFAYLKNSETGDRMDQALEGILLYPTVGTSLDLSYVIQGHSIRVATVDLNSDWRSIRRRLLTLIATDDQRKGIA